MPPTPGDASSIEQLVSGDDLARLACPYDRFTEPRIRLSEQYAIAEQVFNRDAANSYDLACYLHPELRKIGFKKFRFKLVSRYRQFLKKN